MIVASPRLLRLLNSITTSCSTTLLPSTQRGAAAAAFAGRRWQQPARSSTALTTPPTTNLAAAVVVSSSTAVSHSSVLSSRSLSLSLRGCRFSMTSATRKEPVSAAATAADKPEPSASVVDVDDNANLDLFDRSVFNKTLSVPALRVPNRATAALLKSLRGHTLDIPKIPAVTADPVDPKSFRLVLLSPEEFGDAAKKHEEEATPLAEFLACLPPTARDVATSFTTTLAWHDVQLDYSHASLEEALRRLLPPGAIGDDGPPSSFETVGHIAHLNLRQEHLPYKRIIGGVLLDKNPRLRVVVNKVGSIENEFRVFAMEVIAGSGGGDGDTVAEVSQHGCRFSLDYSKVYWNSRLEAEHSRLVELEFKPGDVVVDAMAGVGPFAIPAAKFVRGCIVYANDLNPESTRWLKHNARRNKVANKVMASCCDARDFIRAFGGVDERAWESVFGGGEGGGGGEGEGEAAAATEDKRRLANPPAALVPPPPPPKTGLRYQHVVMNLPATAIEFLDAFAGSLSPQLYPSDEDNNESPKLPRVHVYCFERAGEPPATTLARVAETLGGQPEDATVRLVRDVSPSKRMLCVSFTLPRAVAVAATAKGKATAAPAEASAAKRQKVEGGAAGEE